MTKPRQIDAMKQNGHGVAALRGELIVEADEYQAGWRPRGGGALQCKCSEGDGLSEGKQQNRG